MLEVKYDKNKFIEELRIFKTVTTGGRNEGKIYLHKKDEHSKAAIYHNDGYLIVRSELPSISKGNGYLQFPVRSVERFLKSCDGTEVTLRRVSDDHKSPEFTEVECGENGLKFKYSCTTSFDEFDYDNGKVPLDMLSTEDSKKFQGELENPEDLNMLVNRGVFADNGTFHAGTQIEFYKDRIQVASSGDSNLAIASAPARTSVSNETLELDRVVGMRQIQNKIVRAIARRKNEKVAFFAQNSGFAKLSKIMIDTGDLVVSIYSNDQLPLYKHVTDPFNGSIKFSVVVDRQDIYKKTSLLMPVSDPSFHYDAYFHANAKTVSINVGKSGSFEIDSILFSGEKDQEFSMHINLSQLRQCSKIYKSPLLKIDYIDYGKAYRISPKGKNETGKDCCICMPLDKE